MKQAAIEEAIGALGLVKPEAGGAIAQIIDATLSGGLHPRGAARDYRKLGEQISADQKKSLGIAKNGFLSVAALADLTAEGLRQPMTAHELTVLRACFTINRARIMEMARDRGHAQVRYDGVFYMQCAACSRLNGRVVEVETVSLFPPEDCARPGCALGLRLYFDRFKGLI